MTDHNMTEEQALEYEQQNESMPQTEAEGRLCIHGIKVWFGHECGDCMDQHGKFVWDDIDPADRQEETVFMDFVLDGSYVDEFVSSYVACAFWSSTDDEDTPMDDNYGPEDLADETREEIQRECSEFIDGNTDLALVDPSQAGHDFWLTRNHHGTGFWDRGLGELGDRLTSAAHVWGSSDLYVGDDGKVYVQ